MLCMCVCAWVCACVCAWGEPRACVCARVTIIYPISFLHSVSYLATRKRVFSYSTGRLTQLMFSSSTQPSLPTLWNMMAASSKQQLYLCSSTRTNTMWPHMYDLWSNTMWPHMYDLWSNTMWPHMHDLRNVTFQDYLKLPKVPWNYNTVWWYGFIPF